MPNDDLQFRLRRQESDLSSLQSKMSTQKRIKELRDDPLAAAKAVRYESYLARLERFEDNALYARITSRWRRLYASGPGRPQRVRELAVQGANGSYSRRTCASWRRGERVAQELVATANASVPTGKRLFAETRPTRSPSGQLRRRWTVPARASSPGSSIRSRGDPQAEVSEAPMRSSTSGARGLLAERMQIFSSFDATAYRVSEPSSFFVDGNEIRAAPGDTIHALVAKINDSAAPGRPTSIR
jgi:flagellar hook-associated protein 3 FlgL